MTNVKSVHTDGSQRFGHNPKNFHLSKRWSHNVVFHIKNLNF